MDHVASDVYSFVARLSSMSLPKLPGIRMSQTLSTSVRLIEQAKRHEPAAWERLAQLYGPLVYGWARQSGLQPSDAADVAQDVFRSVFQAIERFDQERPDGRFRSWLLGVTRNRLRDFFRSQQQQPVGVGGTTAHMGIQQVLDQALSERSLAASTKSLAMRALAMIETDFEETTWRAFWRTAIEGHAPQKVAEELGLSVASVYKAKSRVLQRLREELGETLESDEAV